MNTKVREPISVEEYFQLEMKSDVRHEFVNGKLFAMAGETRKHEEIVLNFVEFLRPKARNKNCRLYTTNIKLQVKGNKYRYPDVMISCVPASADPRLEEFPCFIVEVLSESTALTDITDKLEEYTRLESLQRYALVEQHLKRVTVYKRTDLGWLLEILDESGEVDVPCLDTKISLEEIYSGLEFAVNS
jgi:Uma2 family endonuclease